MSDSGDPLLCMCFPNSLDLLELHVRVRIGASYMYTAPMTTCGNRLDLAVGWFPLDIICA